VTAGEKKASKMTDDKRQIYVYDRMINVVVLTAGYAMSNVKMTNVKWTISCLSQGVIGPLGAKKRALGLISDLDRR
jgi:hypothetical protein